MKTYLILALSLMFFTVEAQEASPKVTQELNDALDMWHRAAATGDSTYYFGLFAKEGMFLGTDATEIWTVDEFWSFSKPYFRRGKAWDFTPLQRNLYQAGDVVWFDEVLSTWMDKCRGTGVFVKEDGAWKLAHYSLSVLVPNETVEDYLQLLNK